MRFMIVTVLSLTVVLGHLDVTPFSVQAASAPAKHATIRAARAVPGRAASSWIRRAGGHNTEFDGVAPARMRVLGGHNTEFDTRNELAVPAISARA